MKQPWSLAQVGCMRQALGPGALGKPRGSGWRGRWEGGSGWGPPSSSIFITVRSISDYPLVHTRSLSCLQLFAIPLSVAYQAPLSMGFPRQEYCSGLPFPIPGNLPNPGIEPALLRLLHPQVDSLPLSHPEIILPNCLFLLSLPSPPGEECSSLFPRSLQQYLAWGKLSYKYVKGQIIESVSLISIYSISHKNIFKK